MVRAQRRDRRCLPGTSRKNAPSLSGSLSYPLNYIIDWILAQVLKDYPGVQVGVNVHVSDFANADDIAVLSSSYNEMRSLLETVNPHAATVGMRIDASKIKTLIPGEQRQAVLLDGEPLEDVEVNGFVPLFIDDDYGPIPIQSQTVN